MFARSIFRCSTIGASFHVFHNFLKFYFHSSSYSSLLNKPGDMVPNKDVVYSITTNEPICDSKNNQPTTVVNSGLELLEENTTDVRTPFTQLQQFTPVLDRSNLTLFPTLILLLK